MMWGYGWGGWVGGFLMMALFWGGLALVAYLLVRTTRPGSTTPSEPAKGLDILAERFARGEITAEEFKERRSVIEGRAG